MSIWGKKFGAKALPQEVASISEEAEIITAIDAGCRNLNHLVARAKQLGLTAYLSTDWSMGGVTVSVSKKLGGDDV